MNRQDAERIITEYLKPIFGFALKRCKSEQDAEDLSQEIVLRAFRALLIKNDIADVGKFIWTVAHNTLSNYYRDCAKSTVGVSLDEVAEVIADPYSEDEVREEAETVHRLQSEIAYLSKLQRRILIAYYFENRKQADIARELGIPVGTVKWHLFEAKKELKRGMDTVRKTSELKFNPIKFHSYGINGSSGTMSTDEFFRSTLSQNISYCVRNAAKVLKTMRVTKGKYFVVSAHREENIADERHFLNLVDCLNEIAAAYKLPIIVSTHPRTRKMIEKKGVKFDKLVKLMKPMGLTEYLALQLNAKAVLSDSGTISEESSILGFKALNLREAHERPEAMEEAAVMMVGQNKQRILQALKHLDVAKPCRKVYDYSMPDVSEKVVRIIISYTDYIKRRVWGETF